MALLVAQPSAGLHQATSAAHVLSLLDEEDDSLKLYALQQLDRSVHDFWFQISSSVAAIEALYEDDEFSHRELAALVASKVRLGRSSRLQAPTFDSASAAQRQERCPGARGGGGGPEGLAPCGGPATDVKTAAPLVGALLHAPTCRSFTTWATWTTP